MTGVQTCALPICAINISKNLVQHSQTKQIEIWHHFIRKLVKNGTLTLKFIHTNDQKADLFTKTLDNKRFEFLRQNIGVISMDWSLLLLLLPHAFASSFMHWVVLFNMFLFWLVFSFVLFCFSYKNKIKKIEKYKNSVCLCTLVFVYLGWSMKQSFLNFVSLVI